MPRLASTIDPGSETFVRNREANLALAAELRERVDKTLSFVGGVTAAQFEGAETREIVLSFPTNTLKFTGLDYWTHFALPNFYFHLTTAYDLLRANGVELGKRDFLGQIQ